MFAPLTGCVRSRRESRASAGGQLEHPSEVNSSTRTGVEAGSGALDGAGSFLISAEAECARSGRRTIQTRSSTAATEKMNALSRELMKLPFGNHRHFATSYSNTE